MADIGRPLLDDKHTGVKHETQPRRLDDPVLGDRGQLLRGGLILRLGRRTVTCSGGPAARPRRVLASLRAGRRPT